MSLHWRYYTEKFASQSKKTRIESMNMGSPARIQAKIHIKAQSNVCKGKSSEFYTAKNDA